MSKWLKTRSGSYINSSHIRVFWIKHLESTDSWYIMAKLDLLLDEDGYESNETVRTINCFDTKEEAADELEEIINGLEGEEE